VSCNWRRQKCGASIRKRAEYAVTQALPCRTCGSLEPREKYKRQCATCIERECRARGVADGLARCDFATASSFLKGWWNSIPENANS